MASSILGDVCGFVACVGRRGVLCCSSTVAVGRRVAAARGSVVWPGVRGAEDGRGAIGEEIWVWEVGGVGVHVGGVRRGVE